MNINTIKIPHDGGPAFPVGPLGDTSTPDGLISHQFPGSPGMSMRDHFAGLAMQALIHENEEYDEGVIATAAYEMAAHMIAARDAIYDKDPPP